MKYLVLLALLVFASPVYAHALTLQWDAVVTGTDNLPLAPGGEVTKYSVYRCPTPTASASTCNKSTASKVADIQAPSTEYALINQTFPSSYFVTATNLIDESLESAIIKIVPPNAPKNFRIK